MVVLKNGRDDTVFEGHAKSVGQLWVCDSFMTFARMHVLIHVVPIMQAKVENGLSDIEPKDIDQDLFRTTTAALEAIKNDIVQDLSPLVSEPFGPFGGHWR